MLSQIIINLANLPDIGSGLNRDQTSGHLFPSPTVHGWESESQIIIQIDSSGFQKVLAEAMAESATHQAKKRLAPFPSDESLGYGKEAVPIFVVSV